MTPTAATGPSPTTEFVELARDALADQRADNEVAPTRGVRGTKSAMLRLARRVTERLVRAGEALASGLERLEQAHGEQLGDHQRLLATLDERVAHLERAVDAETTHREAVEVAHGGALEHLKVALAAETTTREELGAAIDTSATLTRRLQDDQQHLADQVQRIRSNLLRIQTRLDSSVSRPLPNEEVPDSSAPPALAGDSTLEDEAYQDFEERFRGSRESVKQRQSEAVRLIADRAGNTAPVLDLGSGRGEWLELLGEAGIHGYGVDLNGAAVELARRSGVEAQIGDALAHLESLEPDSLEAVTAFHFVEHIPLPALIRLLDRALVTLRPGGMIMFETPNPENLVVGAANFYLDPTHLRPLHPGFLKFLAESRGFVDVEIHRVHPALTAEELGADGNADYSDARLRRVVQTVEWALFGAQDYLLTGVRPADADGG